MARFVEKPAHILNPSVFHFCFQNVFVLLKMAMWEPICLLGINSKIVDYLQEIFINIAQTCTYTNLDIMFEIN